VPSVDGVRADRDALHFEASPRGLRAVAESHVVKSSILERKVFKIGDAFAL